MRRLTYKLPIFYQGSLQKGFTLVELLVVIAVLGVLASAVLAAIDPAAQLAKARNSARKASLKQIADALDRYRVNYGTYPVTSTWCGPAGSAWSGACPDPANWIPGLVASGEMKSLPQDPRAGQTFLPCNSPTLSYFIYYSNGIDYKVMAHCGREGTYDPTDPFSDPYPPNPAARSHAWAVYTPGAAGW